MPPATAAVTPEKRRQGERPAPRPWKLFPLYSESLITVRRLLVFVELQQPGAELGAAVDQAGRLGRLGGRVSLRGRQRPLVLQEVEEGDDLQRDAGLVHVA